MPTKPELTPGQHRELSETVIDCRDLPLAFSKELGPSLTKAMRDLCHAAMTKGYDLGVKHALAPSTAVPTSVEVPMTKRGSHPCKCPCHHPGGVKVLHFIPCCYPDK